LCPYFTLFSCVCTTTPYELCKGLYHHNGVCHESSRPQIHRFRPQARAPPLGVYLPHQRCGDGEFSGSGVSEGVCEAPTFMEWSAVVVPTCPECGSHALQVCQHHHQVVRVGHFVGLSETQRTRCTRLHRPIWLRPSRYHSTQRALWYREGGGRWPVRPRVRGVPPRCRIA
jgi:hypothetical protein